MAQRHLLRPNPQRPRPPTRPAIRPRMEITLECCVSAQLWNLWRSLWLSVSFRFHVLQRKSLRDKSKAPLTRSTPKPELRAERVCSAVKHGRIDFEVFRQPSDVIPCQLAFAVQHIGQSRVRDARGGGDLQLRLVAIRQQTFEHDRI